MHSQKTMRVAALPGVQSPAATNMTVSEAATGCFIREGLSLGSLIHLFST